MSVKYGKLPDKLYKVRVPVISTYTEEEMAALGFPAQVNQKGRVVTEETVWSNVMLPLTQIIDIYSTGAPIRLTDPKEVTELHTVLEEYLRNHNPNVRQFNASTYEETRDLDIDKFAAEIFGLNRSTIVEEVINKPTGFDIGVGKLSLTAHAPVTKPRRRNRYSPSEKYASQNPVSVEGYIEPNTIRVNPDEVERTNAVKRRRRRPKHPGAQGR